MKKRFEIEARDIGTEAYADAYVEALLAVALELRDACQYLGTIEADTAGAGQQARNALARAKEIGL